MEAKNNFQQDKKQRSRGGRKGGGRDRKRPMKEADEFDQKIIDIARVTRVMAGGKRMSFRACVVVGNKKGKIGMGVKKGADVSLAVNKAVAYAKKHLVTIKINGDTISHTIRNKNGGAVIFLKPATKGTGVIAGGAMRPVIEVAGIKDVIGKMLGSKNKINNVAATIEALTQLRERKSRVKLTDKTIAKI